MGRAKKSTKKTDQKGELFYFFGDHKTEGNGQMKDLLGGKGANLAEMSRIGAPVPPGFTISTLVFRQFYENGMKLNREVDQQMENYLKRIEKSIKAGFGDPKNPLLVSVRSGSKFSMPGMMDTILNIGLNDKTLQGLIEKSKNPRFAYDCYRRLLQMFGNVVMGIDKALFEHIIQKKKDAKKIKLDTSLSIDDLKDIIEKFKKLIKEKAGEEFPQNPLKQLQLARDAVFKSWNSPRAITYRRQYKISSDLGTAVNIQAMVFGNLGDHSLTGVGFTRNPSNGEKHLYGEYLTNAQGEDVVAGIRTPKPLVELRKKLPEVYKQLLKVTEKLERHYKDLQDFEFTVQEKKLYMLQTRTGKRTAQAAVKIAVEMVKEKLISTEEALKRISPEHINQLLHPRIDTKAQLNIIAKGLPASPGAARGKVVFKSEDAIRLSEAGEKVILVRQETNPDDIAGMIASQGILTARGGMTSHAAVVARGMGKPCIVGCESIRVNEEKKQFFVGGVMVRERENITLNGSTGEVILGNAPLLDPEFSGEFARSEERRVGKECRSRWSPYH